MFKATFKSINETVKAEGETVLEAFNNLAIKHPKLIVATIRVENGETFIEKVLSRGVARRFAINPITRGIWAKLLATRFKNG